jgi:4-hydroxybenzoyl-CoA thioesterase
VTVGDAQATGCDVFYRVTEVSGGREVARAKTGMTFFDYVRRRPVAIPPSFQAMLERVATT